MLTLYHLKPAFQNRLRPLLARLARWNVSPNQITIAAIALSSGFGLAIAAFSHSPRLLLGLPLVLLGRMALNALDGMLARDYDRATPLGCILNELGDVTSDLALYLPFALIPGISAAWIVGIAILASLTELAGVLGQAIAGTRRYEGPMGKSDRALAFGAVGLALGLGMAPAPWLTGIWCGIVLLECWTLVNRIRATLQECAPCS